MNKVVTIGITECSSYTNYERWLKQWPSVKTVMLSWSSADPALLSTCDGILLSGGEDIHPSYYHKSEYTELCHEINETRDTYEWKILSEAERLSLPILGVCRGLQVANVFYGGTLIPDLPTFGKFNHSKFAKHDRYHEISVDPDSFLSEIAGCTSGRINSSHHQAADRIGKDLVASALSPDGVVEAIERKNRKDLPFLMLVQWHPERMDSLDNPFSNRIAQAFLDAAAERSR